MRRIRHDTCGDFECTIRRGTQPLLRGKALTKKKKSVGNKLKCTSTILPLSVAIRLVALDTFDWLMHSLRYTWCPGLCACPVRCGPHRPCGWTARGSATTISERPYASCRLRWCLTAQTNRSAPIQCMDMWPRPAPLEQELNRRLARRTPVDEEQGEDLNKPDYSKKVLSLRSSDQMSHELTRFANGHT
jgi:hypothetical protein